jgi:fructokinase
MTAPILVAGEALYDLVVRDDTMVPELHAGGGPFNTARTVGRLCQPVAFLGRISTDRLGTTLGRILAADGVDLATVVETDDPTTLALAELDAGGAAKYRFYHAGTSAPGLTPAAALSALPASVGVLCVGTLGLVLEPMATALETVVQKLSGSTLIALDPNCRPSLIPDADAYRQRLHRVLASTDLVKISDEDLAWLSPGSTALDAARALLELGPRVVLLTQGPDGATVLGAGAEVSVPAPPTEVIDTIGAGDAFLGAFLAWWRSHRLSREELRSANDLVRATHFACVVATRTCACAGASPPRVARDVSNVVLDELSLSTARA